MTSTHDSYFQGALEQVALAAQQLSWSVEDIMEQWQKGGGRVDGDIADI